MDDISEVPIKRKYFNIIISININMYRRDDVNMGNGMKWDVFEGGGEGMVGN